MKQFFFGMFVSLVCIVAQGQTNEQIIFTNNGICIGDNWCSPYHVTINNFDGFEFLNGNCWLKFDLRASQLSISGSNDVIIFYDRKDEFFNAVRCSYFNVVSDSCLKTNIVPLLTSKKLFKTDIEMKSKLLYEDKNIEDADFVNNLQKRFPDLVSTTRNGIVIINYAEVVPLLIKEIQDLDEEISATNNLIDEFLNELP